MKKLLLLFAVVITFIGCSPNEDDNPKFHLELLPVQSIDLPAEFTRGVVYDLHIQFIRPTTCHLFDGFFYEKNLNVRTIAVQTSVVELNSCMPTSQEPTIQVLKFKPAEESSYIFKLWKGKDAYGVNVYEEIEVPVVE